ncbi:MAG: DUF3180 domain-containing protein [Propionibacteriaceae bacterium]|nr:DUF3180 domain-containing protein [Propionibacteriaceae bacterium]
MAPAGHGTPSPNDADPDPDSGRLGFTRPRTLGIAAAAGALLGALVTFLAEQRAGYPPVLPWTGPLVLVFVAALLSAMAFSTWRRIQVRKEQVEPQRGITLLALAKASAIGGAAIAAGYLVFALMGAGNLVAAGPQQRLIRGLVAAVAGAGICAAGSWLERACRVPDPPEDEDDEPLPG